MRMLRHGQYKLIYYPAGNRMQLFDLDDDPMECSDLSTNAECADMRDHLEQRLIGELYGDDTAWVRDGTLVGMEEPEHEQPVNRGFSGQRGWR